MKALVVGGDGDFVQTVLTPRLFGVGIEVDTVWNCTKSRAIKKIPSACEAVIVLRDWVGHPMRDVFKNLAKRGGLYFAEISNKWSVANQDLIKAGLVNNGGEAVERETLNLGVDYNATVQRVVDFAKEYYEKNGKRPKPKSVAHNLKISSHFVGMQRGINQGVALAKNVPFKTDEKPPLKEVIASHLQDSPEWILDLDDMASTVAMMREDENDTKFKKRVVTIALNTQKGWKKADARPKNSPEKIFLVQLKTKWLDSYARKYNLEHDHLPSHQDSNIECYRVFQSYLSRALYREVIDGMGGQTKEQAERETAPVEDEGIIPADPDGLIPSTMDKSVEDTTSTPDEKGVQVTEKTNLSAGKVSHLEVKEALPKAKKKKSKSKTKRGGLRQATLDKINPFRHLIGVEHDEVVAKKAGVSRTSIRRYREQNGIPRVPTVTFRQGGMVTRTDTKSTSTVQPMTTHVTVEAQSEATYLEPELGEGFEDSVPDAVWKQELLNLRRDNATLRQFRQRLGEQIESWKQEFNEQAAKDAAEIERLNDEIDRLNAEHAAFKKDLEKEIEEKVRDGRLRSTSPPNGVPTTGSMIDQHIAMGHKVTFQIHSGD